MVSCLSQFKLPPNFANASLKTIEAENILARIPNVVDIAVNWFEVEFDKADESDKRKREQSLRKMMVSSIQQADIYWQ